MDLGLPRGYQRDWSKLTRHWMSSVGLAYLVEDSSLTEENGDGEVIRRGYERTWRKIRIKAGK